MTQSCYYIWLARPRVFISSTFYDLRQVRSDIERFIRELGYEPIRHETGAVAYSKDEPLETGAYREIELSDVIVFITGGNFGSESKEEPGYSISQVELKRAPDKGIPVFIFVETSVLNEYSTYKLNKGAKDINCSSVDESRFLNFWTNSTLFPVTTQLPSSRSPVTSRIFFENNFAGLFHRFLQEQKRLKEMRVLVHQVQEGHFRQEWKVVVFRRRYLER